MTDALYVLSIIDKKSSSITYFRFSSDNVALNFASDFMQRFPDMYFYHIAPLLSPAFEIQASPTGTSLRLVHGAKDSHID